MSSSSSSTPKLQSKRLGKTGLMVSELCFGCMTIGPTDQSSNWGLPTADEAESFRMLDEYAAWGGNFFDTANVYGAGDSEIVLGKWLQGKRREDFVIATKVRGAIRAGPNDTGLSRKHIMAEVNESLKRLQTDYIDLYQVHSFDVDTPLEETLSALNDLVRSGKVRYLGVSNYSGWQLQKALDISEKRGFEKFVSLQPQYNLLCRSTEWDLTRICEAEGLGCLPWSPLAGGWLSGKINRNMDKPAEGSRVAWAEKRGWRPTGWSEHANEHTWRILDELERIAKKHGKTVAQVALRWLMQKPGVTAPIFGAKSVEQLRINLGAATFTLTAEEMAALDKASFKEPPYPWNQMWNVSRSRL